MIENLLGTLRTALCIILTFFIALSASISGLFLGGQRAWEFWREAWGKTILFFLGVKMQINGKENLKGPAVFIMNHESLIDIFTIAAITPLKTTFVSKKEVARFPFVGIIMRMGGCIFIDRSNSRSAVESIKEGVKERRENYSIIVFPEGTRSNAKQGLKPFKKGCMHIAMEAGIPIIPIGQNGARTHASGKSIVLKKGSPIYFEIGKPISTNMWNLENTEKQMQFLREEVKSLIAKAKAKREKALKDQGKEDHFKNDNFSTKAL